MRKGKLESDSFESLLKREIKMLGLAPNESIVDKPEFIDELSFALRRHPHEGKIPHYGVIFTSTLDFSAEFEVVAMVSDDCTLARMLADGIRSFVVYANGSFYGLGRFKSQGLDEYLLIDFLENPAVELVITGDTTGITKIYTRSGVIEHHQRRWYQKQSINSVLSQISNAVPQAPVKILRQVLAFALHTLSPRRIGATLVFSLQHPTEMELSKMKPQIDLTALQLGPMDSDHRAILRQCLSQVDGATLLDPRGVVVGTGAQLKCSAESISLIHELKGTRHTSAKRFSFDYSPGLVITVSADGPVTVFSDGVNLAEIFWYSAETAAAGMRKMMPDRRDDVTADEYCRTCSKCGKTSIVHEVVILGWKEREEAHCPVCGNVLESAMCFTLTAAIKKVL